MSYDESNQIYNEAKIVMSAEDIEMAISLFQKSNELYPHFKTLELWGECEMKLGNYREAITRLSLAVNLNGHIRPRSLLARAYNDSGEKNKAIKLAKAILLESPNNKVAKGIAGE